MTIAMRPEISMENRKLVRDIVILGTAFFVLSAVAYVATISWTKPFPLDSTRLVVGRDFLNFWMYGRAAVSANPGHFYNQQVYVRALFELLRINYAGQNWSYPPSIMLFAAPFGQLGYFPALLCWTSLSLLIFVLVARCHLSDRRLVVALTLSPAAAFCLRSGQSSFLTAAALITIVAWLDRRPLLAGILIGCLTLKPQLGILFPFMLAASSRWRVFFSAAATAIGLASLTAILFGPQVWVEFVLKGLPVQNQVLADPNLVATPFYPTIFMNVRGAGASYAIAMAVQLCFSAFAVAAVTWAFRYCKNADPQMLLALFLACSITASPYLLAYDVLGLTFAALILLNSDKLDQSGRWLAQLVYWLPVLQLSFGALHIPGPALVPPIFAGYLLYRLGAARLAAEDRPSWLPSSG